MIPSSTYRASAPTLSVDAQPAQTQPFTAGQVVKAQVLERLNADKSLISINGMKMHATTEISVAAGDTLYFTVRSAEPLVLQLHGMEYRTVNPFGTVDSVVRLLNLTSDRLTTVILSQMMSRNQKISKSDVEENRRAILDLRSDGVGDESDEELLDAIYFLRSKKLPLTSAYVRLAAKRTASEDMAELGSGLLALLAESDVPDDVKDPIARYFRNHKKMTDSIRSAVKGLGIDYENSLLKWALGSAEAPTGTSLKASLLALLAWLDADGGTQGRRPIRTLTGQAIDFIESQQLNALGDPAANEMTLHIPIMLDGMLRSVSLTILSHGGGAGGGMFQEHPLELSFRIGFELSELGTVTATGRLAGTQLSAALTVNDEYHARMLEEHIDELASHLREKGCLPVSLTARKGIPGASLLRRTVNVTA
jgi:Flagellar hook-length control protein FliK